MLFPLWASVYSSVKQKYNPCLTEHTEHGWDFWFSPSLLSSLLLTIRCVGKSLRGHRATYVGLLPSVSWGGAMRPSWPVGCEQKWWTASMFLAFHFPPPHRVGPGCGGVCPALTTCIKTSRQEEPGNMGDLMARVARFTKKKTWCLFNLNSR